MPPHAHHSFKNLWEVASLRKLQHFLQNLPDKSHRLYCIPVQLRDRTAKTKTSDAILGNIQAVLAQVGVGWMNAEEHVSNRICLVLSNIEQILPATAIS